MARGCSHLTGCGGDLCHGAAVLLLLGSAAGELEGSEEEDGPLSYVTQKEIRLNALD